jgi:hypothetical protein
MTAHVPHGTPDEVKADRREQLHPPLHPAPPDQDEHPDTAHDQPTRRKCPVTRPACRPPLPHGGARSEENYRPLATPGGARSKENSGAIS